MSARIEAIRKRRRDRAMLFELRNNPAWGPIIPFEPAGSLRDRVALEIFAALLLLAPDAASPIEAFQKAPARSFALADKWLEARKA